MATPHQAGLTARPGPGGGIFVAQASARVRLNQFVLGYRWGEAISGDLAEEGAGAFAHLTVERNRVA